jgi:hypothetical protein
MPSPKDGTEVSPAPPTDPTEAHDADTANPGEVEAIKQQQRETGTGKYGAQPVAPFVPPDPDDPDSPKSWIAIKLVDQNGKPCSGEPYKITLSNGTVVTGTLGQDGTARVDGLDPGSAQVTFPKLDNLGVQPS